MKFTVYVTSIEAIPQARTDTEAVMQDGDELEIVVTQPAPVPAERNERKQPGSLSGATKGN